MIFRGTNSFSRVTQSLAIATTIFSAEATPEVSLKTKAFTPFPTEQNTQINRNLEYKTKAGDSVFTVAQNLDLNTSYLSLYRYLTAKQLLINQQLKVTANISQNDFKDWEKIEATKFSDRTTYIPAEGNIIYYKIKRGDQFTKILQSINKELQPEDCLTPAALIKFNNLINIPAAIINSPDKIVAGNTLLFPRYQNKLEMFVGHPFLNELSKDSLQKLDLIFSSSLANNLSLSQMIESSSYQELNLGHKEGIIKIFTALIKNNQIDTSNVHRNLFSIINPDEGIGKLLAGSKSKECLNLLLQMIEQGPVADLKMSPIKAIGEIFNDFANWQANFQQGDIGTCAPTSVSLELVEHYPLELLQLISNLYIRGQANYQDISDPDYPEMLSNTQILVTKEQLKEINNCPNSLQVLLQASFMEYANGTGVYILAEDCHYSANLQEKHGHGSSMVAMSSILTLITKHKYSVYAPPITEEDIQDLAKIAETQPVILSLAWRQLSEQDTEKLIQKKGGTKAHYQNEDGYSLHAVAFQGYDPENKLVLIINPHPNDQQERDLKTPVNHKSEIERYSWGSGIQAIPLEVYQTRVKEIARAQQKNERNVINWAFAVDLEQETLNLKDDDWNAKLFFKGSDHAPEDWFRDVFPEIETLK